MVMPEKYVLLREWLWIVVVLAGALLVGAGTAVGFVWRRRRLRYSRERSGAAEALRESEEQLRATFELASIGIAQADPNTGRWLRVNHKMCAITGYSAEELLQMRVPEMNQPEDRQRDWESFQRVVRGETPDYHQEKRYVRKDGTLIWVNVITTVLLDAAGRPLHTVATIEDITERKRELENISRMATVVRDSNDAITIQDFEGRITAWNRGAELMYGYSEEEALQTNMGRLTAPGKVEEQKDFSRRLMAGEMITSFETQRVTKDGRVLDVWMTVTKLLDDAGKPIGIASTERDITERKRELENISRMATVVRDSNDAITIQDFEGRITAWNRGAELMYGYSEEEALLANIERLTAPGKVEEQKDFSRRLMAGEMITSFETRRLTRDGRVLDVWMTVTKLLDEAGKPIGIASTERDITERKKAEETIKEYTETLEIKIQERTRQLEDINLKLQAVNKEIELRRQEAETAKLMAMEASRAKSDFLANMSHELRTPLNAIIGFSEVLQDELYGNLNKQQQEYVGDVLSGGKHLLSLINDILDLSKVESGKMELELTTFALPDVLEMSMVMFKEKALKHNITLSLEIEPDAGIEIKADERNLKQVMFNLLGNALKFTPDGGSVHIHVRGIYDAGHQMPDAAVQKGWPDFIEISIEDTGIGIKQEDMGKLFHAFSQLESPYEKKHEGTGLGLSLTKKLIELHGGSIRVESEFGRGSRFSFVIPVKQE